MRIKAATGFHSCLGPINMKIIKTICNLLLILLQGKEYVPEKIKKGILERVGLVLKCGRDLQEKKERNVFQVEDSVGKGMEAEGYLMLTRDSEENCFWFLQRMLIKNENNSRYLRITLKRALKPN